MGGEFYKVVTRLLFSLVLSVHGLAPMPVSLVLFSVHGLAPLSACLVLFVHGAKALYDHDLERCSKLNKQFVHPGQLGKPFSYYCDEICKLVTNATRPVCQTDHPIANKTCYEWLECIETRTTTLHTTVTATAAGATAVSPGFITGVTVACIAALAILILIWVKCVVKHRLYNCRKINSGIPLMKYDRVPTVIVNITNDLSKVTQVNNENDENSKQLNDNKNMPTGMDGMTNGQSKAVQENNGSDEKSDIVAHSAGLLSIANHEIRELREHAEK